MTEPALGPGPGIHRLPTATATAAALQAWREAGWRVVPVAPSGSTADLYAALADALGLPGWFGHNLDALWDCLTELEEPTVMVLAAWEHYRAAEPSHAARLVEVLRDRTETPPPFAVLLA